MERSLDDVGEQSTSVRPATKQDLEGIVRIHTAAFPDNYLTHLGPGVLHRYYGGYLNDPDAVNLVAEQSGELAAFSVGSYRDSRVLEHFYEEHSGYLTWSTLRRVLVLDPVVLRGLPRRMARIWDALRAFLFPHRRKEPVIVSAPDVRDHEVIGSLVSIATAPKYQGCGVSSEVLEQFEQELRGKGATEAHLSVSASNGRALAFYAKHGWTVLEGDHGSLSLGKHL